MLKLTYVLVLFSMLHKSESSGELCESITVSGEKQTAFSCPRLFEADDLLYCCGNRSVLLQCCSSMNESIYSHKKENEHNSNTTPHYSISVSIVAIYAVLLVLLCVVDSISHFGIWKRRRRKD